MMLHERLRELFEQCHVDPEDYAELVNEVRQLENEVTDLRAYIKP